MTSHPRTDDDSSGSSISIATATAPDRADAATSAGAGAGAGDGDADTDAVQPEHGRGNAPATIWVIGHRNPDTDAISARPSVTPPTCVGHAGCTRVPPAAAK